MAKKQLPLRPAGPDTVAALLDWYDREGRDLPWRYRRGQKPDPYRVWLSEIMLQQTRVKAVIPYFERFLGRFPKVAKLAAADEDEVLQLWAGLGYYSRARNMHACAKAVVDRHGGKFPKDEALLAELPGIGPYTAAAISAIAYGEYATPVDGNIERVVARLFAVETPLPKAKKNLKQLAATLTPRDRPGDFAQAMMDLGATICTPKSPSCLMCPLQQDCHGRHSGLAATLPRRVPKPERPSRYGLAFLVLREDGHVLLRQRPDKGLLASMSEVPSTGWIDQMPLMEEALRTAPVRADWWPVPGLVEHTFTHFYLQMQVVRAIVPVDTTLTFWADGGRCRWVARRDLDGQALPTVMKKLIGHGLRAQ